MLLYFSSCKEGGESLIALEYDPEVVPSMITDKAVTHISDSGVTRYKIVTDVWMVFDKAKEPYWYFPQGIYVERFTPSFQTEVIIEADTAFYYTEKDVWELKKNVHVENMEGEKFDSDELYWDQKEERVYSDTYIEIQQGDTRLKGYGFESDQQMVNYRIFKPHDGKLLIADEPANADSLGVAAPDTINMPDSINVMNHDR